MPLSNLKTNLTLPSLTLPRGGRSRRGANVVGLDIQPGYVTAVQAHVNGGIVVQHAAGAPLPPDAVREGEVLDERTLADALRELFADGRLGKRVRIGLANQRTVLRILELPPVTDRKDLAAAVRFQAEDQVPMPLAGAVLDFHSLGVFDTPAGPRQRVIVVAAQREMVERLLHAVRHAGLRPEGVDLSAFALIRSLYRPSASGGAQNGAEPERVLYLNVGGLTNMAIAEGSTCRFTRVVGGGLEAMAVEIAERRGIPLVDARALLAATDLAALATPAVLAAPVQPAPAPPSAFEPPAPAAPDFDGSTDGNAAAHDAASPDADVDFHNGLQAPEQAGAIETWALAQDPGVAAPPLQQAPAEDEHGAEAASVEQRASTAPAAAAPSAGSAADPADADVRLVLENGIREIVGELRNSLDFHRAQDGGGEVARVVLSGAALELPGFADTLEADLGLAVERQDVHVAAGASTGSISAHRLAIATGLAAEEAPR
jgi:type IV pilus assembly protein PilM